MKYVIGADIGGTTVKLGLFQADGVLLESGRSRPSLRTRGARYCATSRRPLTAV